MVVFMPQICKQQITNITRNIPNTESIRKRDYLKARHVHVILSGGEGVNIKKEVLIRKFDNLSKKCPEIKK